MDSLRYPVGITNMHVFAEVSTICPNACGIGIERVEYAAAGPEEAQRQPPAPQKQSITVDVVPMVFIPNAL